MKFSILDLSLEDLKKKIAELNQPAYRANQIVKAIIDNNIEDFSEITSLPMEFRKILEDNFYIDNIKNTEVQYSTDGTIKIFFEFYSEKIAEAVLIPQKDEGKYTICVSSQHGCKMNCSFCATGKLGFKGNLSFGEIVSQVTFARNLTENAIRNVVFMGMGDPLDNFDEVTKAIDFMMNKVKLFSKRRITVSTVGFPDNIIALADSELGVKLAFSLHTPFQEKRNMIIPSANKWHIKSIQNALEYYYQKTRHRITFEYIVLPAFNDTQSDADKIKKFAIRFPSKINLIHFHDITFTDTKNEILKTASDDDVQNFYNKLKKIGLEVFIRESAGADIDAACGQLAFSKKTAEIL
jgi:23S rRNA (adenine2503-C2)-methyltransferase